MSQRLLFLTVCALACGCCLSGAALAQRDPCEPLLGLLMTPADRVACAAERQQQMLYYQQQQRRAYEDEQRSAAEAAARRQQQELQQQQTRERAAQAAQAAAQRAQERLEALQADRERREAAAREAAERAAAAQEERKRINDLWIAYNRQTIAEQSPDNHCKDHEVARRILREWGEFKEPKALGLEAVDIEHLTTTAYDPDHSDLACHGVFVLNDGSKIVGTFRYRANVAGDIISNWRRDQDQDLSRYDRPPQPAPDYQPAPPQPAPAEALAPVKPPLMAIPSASSGALPPEEQGLADRRQWELWFNGLTGDEQIGANYWSAQRSLPHPASCYASPPGVGPDWERGCLEAQRMLAPFDVRRRSEPAYRVGWNSY